MSVEWLPEESDRDLAAARLERQPEDPMAWHRCGLALAGVGASDELLALADRAASRFGSSVKFFHNVALDLSQRQSWAVIERLAEAVPRTRLEHVITLYYRGCAEVAAGHQIAALDWFAHFKREAILRRQHIPFATDEDLNLIFRQGILVEAPPYVEALRAGPPPPAHNIGFLDDDGEAPAPFAGLYVLDQRYFTRFAAELCAGHVALGTSVPLHFHVLAADSGSFALMEELRRRFPVLRLRFSHEPPGRWDHPVYYTCARFLVLSAVLERYRGAVVALDADILPTLPLESFAKVAPDCDFGCFETGRCEPASVYQASIMVFAPGPASAAFIRDLSRFVLSKLDLPPVLSWMLDQAALYSVLTERSITPSGFRFRALNRGLGPLEGVIRQLSTAEEKNRIMNRRG